jgi:hypothetical protein
MSQRVEIGMSTVRIAAGREIGRSQFIALAGIL